MIARRSSRRPPACSGRTGARWRPLATSPASRQRHGDRPSPAAFSRSPPAQQRRSSPSARDNGPAGVEALTEDRSVPRGLLSCGCDRASDSHTAWSGGRSGPVNGVLATRTAPASTVSGVRTAAQVDHAAEGVAAVEYEMPGGASGQVSSAPTGWDACGAARSPPGTSPASSRTHPPAPAPTGRQKSAGCGSQEPSSPKPSDDPSRVQGSGTRQPSRPFSAPPLRARTGILQDLLRQIGDLG